MRSAAFLAVVVMLGGCGGGRPGTGGPALQAAPLVVAAGATRIAPAPVDDVSAGVNLGRLDLAGVAEVYDLTTPAGEPFVFDILSRGPANSGNVRVSIAHAADNGLTPAGGPETIAAAGVVASASGTSSRGAWLDARGDGFARISVRGVIDREQVIAVETEAGSEKRTALICVGIGPASEINTDRPSGGVYPGVVDRTTIYTSNSWNFGLPTVAVSGDRASLVVYEGDRADPHSPTRYEMRLQHDAATGQVTGGGSEEANPDTGHWRDHEIAALFNVLALARCGGDEVTVKLSFDRGATFGQTETFGRSLVGWAPRLCQVAMAADYTLAVVYWRTDSDGSSDLMLVEGHASLFDGTGSPTRFAFDTPRAVYSFPGDISPVLMGAAFSDGGDLVIGYGFTAWETRADGTWRSTTQFRCAVREYGETLRDGLVEESVVVGRDPSVALVGTGAGMSVFYAYEGADGVRLRRSDDAGRSWTSPVAIGGRAASMPTVFAQQRGADLRVDVLYLDEGRQGTELNLRHWDDYGRTSAEDHRLTEATFVETRTTGGGPPPGALPGIAPPDFGYRVTQVAWFGYDAVRDGDEIVVAYHEQTFDSGIFFDVPVFLGPPEVVGPALPASGDSFDPAVPPPLQEGMDGPVDPADEADLSKLVLLRIG